MALLESPEARVRLTLEGYDSTRARGEKFDDNRLRVAVDVRTAARSWKAVEPCLTTFEARDLADRLRAWAADPAGTEQVIFTEPNLSFFRAGGGEGRVRLNVGLAGGLHPDRPGWIGDPYWIRFEVPSRTLESFAREIEMELARFPER